MQVKRILRRSLVCVALPSGLVAQMTVGGQVVSSAGLPVEGVFVAIPELDIRTRTTTEGRYNFIIRESQIRGQTVTIVARHARLGSQSVQIQVTGGSLTQNFRLREAGPADTSDPLVDRRISVLSHEATRWARHAEFEHPAGPMDVASGLTGRIPGLQVVSASVPGASAPMFYRGPRSFGANTEPLVVVDGIPVTRQSVTSPLQQFGLGGFDYGSPLQDLALDDIASVFVMDRAVATMLYGSRAANGVLVVRTKNGENISGLHIAVAQRFTLERAVRLPRFQNLYGQGLDGSYEFFDGQGGGINDDVPDSWGPKLDGRAVAQHSLTEARRPDVRYWLPDPGGVGDYFGGGRTMEINASVLGSVRSSSMRVAINARDVSGLTPRLSGRRLGLSLHGATQPHVRFRSTAHFQLVRNGMEHRPGTGYAEINPIAGFSRMGRQVDLGALRSPITDASGEQLNWIYTDRNNPWFATERNSNDDHRWHVIGGADAGYAFAPWMTATLRVGVTDVQETRDVAVDSGWKGGYPGSLGRFDFTGGGTEAQSVSASERLADVSFLMRGNARASTLDGIIGVQFRRNEFRTTSTVSDRLASGATIVRNAEQAAGTDVASVYARGGLADGDLWQVDIGARLEQHLDLRHDERSVLYPFASASYDLARVFLPLRTLGIGRAALRATWWRAGNENSPRVLSQVFAGGDSLGIAPDSVPVGESTEGLEIGVRVDAAKDRVSADLSVYRDRSTNVLVATDDGAGNVTVSRQGSVFNGGIEATLRAIPWRGERLTWNVATRFGRNTNTVDALRDGMSTHFIAPALFGASEVLQVGRPVGVIAGTRYLRNENGALILRDGLPLPDAGDTLALLGSWQPNWTAAFQSSLRFARFELFFLIDARVGGKLFSATNMWGSYSGTLESTLVGREDSLLIVGIDSVSGLANAMKVSSQDYFHALGAIHEAWLYDASYTKLREARLTYEMPTEFLWFREHNLRISIVGRNLLTFASAPNMDPETALAPGAFQGFEMGQLPGTRSIGVHLSISP